MEISQRDLVLLSYPFSDLVGEKVRPAIVISNNKYNKAGADVIVVPLTTNLDLKEHSFILTTQELEVGKLLKESRVKVDRIFSVKKEIIRMIIGKVTSAVQNKIIEILTNLVR